MNQLLALAPKKVDILWLIGFVVLTSSVLVRP